MQALNIKSFQGIRTINPQGVESSGTQSANDCKNVILRPNKNTSGFGLYSFPQMSILVDFGDESQVLAAKDFILNGQKLTLFIVNSGGAAVIYKQEADKTVSEIYRFESELNNIKWVSLAQGLYDYVALLADGNLYKVLINGNSVSLETIQLLDSDNFAIQPNNISTYLNRLVLSGKGSQSDEEVNAVWLSSLNDIFRFYHTDLDTVKTDPVRFEFESEVTNTISFNKNQIIFTRYKYYALNGMFSDEMNMERIGTNGTIGPFSSVITNNTLMYYDGEQRNVFELSQSATADTLQSEGLFQNIQSKLDTIQNIKPEKIKFISHNYNNMRYVFMSFSDIENKDKLIALDINSKELLFFDIENFTAIEFVNNMLAVLKGGIVYVFDYKNFNNSFNFFWQSNDITLGSNTAVKMPLHRMLVNLDKDLTQEFYIDLIIDYNKVIAQKFEYKSNQNFIQSVSDEDDLSGGFMVSDEDDLSGRVLAENDEFLEQVYQIEQRVPRFRVLQINIYGKDGNNCGIKSIELKGIAASDSLTVWK